MTKKGENKKMNENEKELLEEINKFNNLPGHYNDVIFLETPFTLNEKENDFFWENFYKKINIFKGACELLYPGIRVKKALEFIRNVNKKPRASY